MAQIRQVYKTWTQLKIFLETPKFLDLQYHEYTYYYKIFILEAGVEYFTEIWKDTSQVKGIDVTQNNLDKTDFEDDYKPNANQAIEQDVTVENNVTIADLNVIERSGDVNRLPVDIGYPEITIQDDESLFQYTLKSNYNTDIETNTSTDTVLCDISGQGVIDLIAINSLTSSNWEVAIEIDGTERLRIPLQTLGSTLSLTDANFGIMAEIANKRFRYHPVQIGYTTGFKVKVKAIMGHPDVNYMVLYKEKAVA